MIPRSRILAGAPARVAAFERYIKAVQDYLSGRAVAFADLDFAERMSSGIDTIELGDAPTEKPFVVVNRR